MVQIQRKLTGEELNIIRCKYNINPNVITKLLNISPKDLLEYEFENKPIPNDIYQKWIDIITPYIH